MAEKRKPTYDLQAFKAVFAHADKLSMTVTAVRTAAALGFGRAEIVATIQTMQRAQFYKSMTSYKDQRILAGCLPCPVGRRNALRQVYGRCSE